MTAGRQRRCRDCNWPLRGTADRCLDCYRAWTHGPLARPVPEPWDGIDEVAVERLVRGEKVRATEAEKLRAAELLGVHRSTIYAIQKAAG